MQLLGLGRSDISQTVAALTGHCVMVRNAERMRLQFNEEETLLSFFARFFLDIDNVIWLPIFVSLMELSSIDIKNIASYIKLSGWFSGVVVLLMSSTCADQIRPLP